MNATMDIGEPSDNGNIIYGLGLYFVILLFIFILYTFHICKHDIHSPTPLTPTANTDDHFIRLTQGLPDDVLATFPTFQCSEAMKTHKVNTHGSGCSICLTDYKPNDVLRTLPECGHLFHVSCVDTWLKAHPTCPMCRNSLKFNVVYVS